MNARKERQRLVIEAQRRRHAADVKRQERRDADRRAAKRARRGR